MPQTRGNQRMTIYDLMDAKGVFRDNPANADSPEYVDSGGPRPYPKMLYHPKGETKVTVPAEVITTPLGPKAVGEQRELISKVVSNPAEERAARAEGWHDHPAKAIAASGREAPPMGPAGQIANLEAEIERLKAELAAQNAAQDEVSALAAEADANRPDGA